MKNRFSNLLDTQASELIVQIPGKADLNHGKIVNKYNITQAKIETYLIPENDLHDFEIARSKQELDAHMKYGIKLFS